MSGMKRHPVLQTIARISFLRNQDFILLLLKMEGEKTVAAENKSESERLD